MSSYYYFYYYYLFMNYFLNYYYYYYYYWKTLTCVLRHVFIVRGIFFSIEAEMPSQIKFPTSKNLLKDPLPNSISRFTIHPDLGIGR